MIKKLSGLKDLKPYDIVSKSSTTKIKFLTTDPLPVIQVTLSYGDTINLFIDTGGGEIILDESFWKN